jgi:hypothetical protein
MRCEDCSEVRGYPYKRSHLVALRSNKFRPVIPVDLVAGRALKKCGSLPVRKCGAFLYLRVPDPGPVGVRVEPLGEAFGPSVLPDGLMVLFPTPPGAGLAVVLPFTEEPVVMPLAAGPPAAELPPAELPTEPPPAPPALCASANVLESAKTVASSIVLSFIGCPFVRAGPTTPFRDRSKQFLHISISRRTFLKREISIVCYRNNYLNKRTHV